MAEALQPAQSPAGKQRWVDAWCAWAWGLGEATFFFIVPDVLLTRFALQKGLTHALRQCLWALAGALVGGLLVYAIARSGRAEQLAAAFTFLPGISPALITGAGASLTHDGWSALFGGALRGTPYKLYALHAGTQALSVKSFLLASLAARLLRFGLTTLAAWWIGRWLGRHLAPARLLQVHLLFWALFYVAYFGIMGG